MKSALCFLAASLALASAPLCALADDEHASHHAAARDTATESLSAGTVRKVDAVAARITIAHGPLQNLGMPAMTMAFRVRDPAMLGTVKAGDKVRFVAASVDGSLTITRLLPAP
jgi:Cu(I)/Ag(I) efflux system protein CusF